jgi:hypothetical protein
MYQKEVKTGCLEGEAMPDEDELCERELLRCENIWLLSQHSASKPPPLPPIMLDLFFFIFSNITNKLFCPY